MTTWERAFDQLYAAQTRALDGVQLLATVGDYAVERPVILGVVTHEEMLMVDGGGTADAGGYSLQMKGSDFSSVPPPQTSVIVNGDALGFSLEISSKDRANGMYMIRVLDVAAA